MKKTNAMQLGSQPHKTRVLDLEENETKIKKVRNDEISRVLRVLDYFSVFFFVFAQRLETSK